MADLPADRHPRVAVIGGSGFYEFLDDPTTVEVSTPYGDPSAPIAVGDVGGRPVAFLPRHGKGHEFPPHKINYRANIWALAASVCEQILAPCAVGGLQPETQPAPWSSPTSSSTAPRAGCRPTSTPAPPTRRSPTPTVPTCARRSSTRPATA